MNQTLVLDCRSVDVKQHFNHQQLLFDSFNAELSPERYWYGPRSLEVWEGVRWGGGEREGELLIFFRLCAVITRMILY